MISRMGKNGEFMACSGYPECRNTQSMPKQEQQQPIPEQTINEVPSPVVEKVLKAKGGSRDGSFVTTTDIMNQAVKVFSIAVEHNKEAVFQPIVDMVMEEYKRVREEFK